MAKLGKKAEDILFQDPTAALMHLRTFAEKLSNIILKLEVIAEPERSTQRDRLSLLENNQILPANIKNMFHFIRSTGNVASHEGGGTLGEAVAKLELAYFIAVWAYKTYDDAYYEPKPFEIPNREQINRSHEQISLEQISDLLRKHGVFQEQGNGKTIPPRLLVNPPNSGIVTGALVEILAPNDKLPHLIEVDDSKKVKKKKPPFKLGDMNNNETQELLKKTDHRSTTRPKDRYIWIVKCHLCKSVYGANGCDFHDRLCPGCKNGELGRNGNPGEPIEGWTEW